MLDVGALIAGLILLVGGGALLVRGSSEIAAALGVSPMVVGLTVVGFGTSAPELVVNSIGASSGATDLAFGNVIGSNISNLALVLGIAAVIAPITMQSQLVRREIPLLLLGTTILAVLAADNVIEGGVAILGRSDAIVLILLFCIFLYVIVLDFLKLPTDDSLLHEIADYPLLVTERKNHFRWLMAIGGCAMLFAGGKLTIDSAVTLAEGFGISSTVIGLFVVAIGTSMPELVTSMIAAAKNESDLALGNVIGSNLFNTLMVMPITGLIRPIPVPAAGASDLAISWLLVALLIPVFFLGEARLSRATGALLLVAYATYAGVRVFGPWG